ncbi:hypothetical protein PRK78_001840 [Emydomyces testavorans]|uniref:Inositol polyphosphate-related phosphatase domain-containing protein n=1 Tax=Emydomyces testavorans TaxID=2070801 RepID=A0AAF0IH25_9EURO|nr:hypothetical protein PRK78_001840 [Emydomyces testavorans]
MELLNVYILTFNCARNLVEPEKFASHIFDGLKPSQPDASEAGTHLPEVLVLALQELAPIAYAFLGGSYLDPYYDAFRDAVRMAGAALVRDGNDYENACYQNLLTRNAGMTALMVFARSDIAERIRYIETAEVGVGVQEAGNKGAVGGRIGYLVGSEEDDSDAGDGIVEVTFVSAHLAPDENGWERRNEDWKSIAQRLIFTSDEPEIPPAHAHEQEDEEGVPLLRASSSLSKPSTLYSPRSYLFVAGDLNYRTSDTGPGPKDYRKFPRPTEETDNIARFADLFAQDQLTREREAGRTLNQLLETKIAFPPTYKYSLEARNLASIDPNGDWKWAANRWPSWCDRILYLNHPSIAVEDEGIKIHEYTALPLFLTSDHRPVVLSASIPLHALPEFGDLPSPVEIDPRWETRRTAARRKELVVGAVAYLGLTWEGNALVLVTLLGVAFVYYALHAFPAS